MNDTIQATLQRFAAQIGDAAQMPDDRRALFEGLGHMSRDQLDEARQSFKRAMSECSPPFDGLGALALAEVERLQGKEARAIRRLATLSRDQDQDASIRRAALLSQLALYQARDDARMIAKIQHDLSALGD